MSTVKEVTVRKSGRRWCADLHWKDGSVWVAWQNNFRTLRAMMESIRCTYDGPVVRT